MSSQRKSRARQCFYTIGYEGRAPADFIALLLDSGVKRLVDVRYNPISRKPGFSKNVLKEALAARGIDYVHIRQLGVPTELRPSQSARQSDSDPFDAYAQTILPGAQAELWQAAELLTEMPSALMCFEADHQMCHRSILARVLAPMTKLKVQHL